MKPIAGVLYALRDSHITYLPPARVLTDQTWFWAHYPDSRPGEFWPVAEGGVPSFRLVYDQLGVPVVRLRTTPDPHISKALPCLPLLRQIELPDLTGPGAVAALKAFQEALPETLELDVVPTRRLVMRWSTYEQCAHRNATRSA